MSWAPVKDPVHINDFEATLLHLFGLGIALVLLAGCWTHPAEPPGSLEHAMTLTTSTGDEVVNPTATRIREALSALDVDRDGVGWAILSRSEMTYIQVAGDATAGFVMEYQEGDVKRHYRAARENFSMDEVVQAFSEYQHGAIDWSTYSDWDQITW